MSIVAACLPTLRPLFGDVVLVPLSESVRRLLSFRSRISTRIGNEHSTDGTNNLAELSPSSAYAQIPEGPSNANKYSAEVYTLTDMRRDGQLNP